ncbi:MAG: OsmC family protein [Nitrospira sp.]|nr:OsmC family protein [Nitrospira sp.]
MKIRPKLTVKEILRGTSVSHTRTDISVRDVETILDEPGIRGGTNMGLSPIEAMMAALVGCTNVTAHKVAKSIEVEIDAMTVGATLTIDRRGILLLEEVDVPFREVDLSIDMTTSANADEIEKIKTDLRRFCPVAKMIRSAGTTINEVWNITRP